jgi:hypothetical protein
MEDFEKIFPKDCELYNIFKQFKHIENIYENSLLAMGYKSNNIISTNTSNFLLHGLEINSNKED